MVTILVCQNFVYALKSEDVKVQYLAMSMRVENFTNTYAVMVKKLSTDIYSDKSIYLNCWVFAVYPKLNEIGGINNVYKEGYCY